MRSLWSCNKCNHSKWVENFDKNTNRIMRVPCPTCNKPMKKQEGITEKSAVSSKNYINNPKFIKNKIR